MCSHNNSSTLGHNINCEKGVSKVLFLESLQQKNKVYNFQKYFSKSWNVELIVTETKDLLLSEITSHLATIVICDYFALGFATCNCGSADHGDAHSNSFIFSLSSNWFDV